MTASGRTNFFQLKMNSIFNLKIDFFLGKSSYFKSTTRKSSYSFSEETREENISELGCHPGLC